MPSFPFFVLPFRPINESPARMAGTASNNVTKVHAKLGMHATPLVVMVLFPRPIT